MLKIVSQTNSEILISSKIPFLVKFTLFIFTFAFGSFFVFVPMLFIPILFSEIGVLRISCDRVEPKQVDCQISKSKFLDLVKQEPLAYKFVNSAKYNVITSKNSEGDSVYRYNFSLLTKFGEKVPFTRTSSSTAENVPSSLNPFLQSKQESFKYTLDEQTESNTLSSFAPIPLLLIFVVIGLNFVRRAFSFLVDYEEILLDKSEYQLRHSKRRILGTKVNRYLFNEVAKVDVLYTTDSYSKVSFTPRITIDFKLKIKLDKIGDRQVAIKIVNDLNRFMGLPEEEDPVVKE